MEGNVVVLKWSAVVRLKFLLRLPGDLKRFEKRSSSMEESKAAEYYEELTRKGEGAARFKQGLGFDSSTRDGGVPARGSALPSSSSSFLGSFVRASSPGKSSEYEKQSQLKSIQSKLKKKPDRETSASRVSDERDKDGESYRRRRRSRSKERESRRRRRSVSRDRDRDRRRRRRSRSGSDEDRRRRRRRSFSPNRRREKAETGGVLEKKEKVDYGKVIEGYDRMTPAERVKAKTKFQLAETAEKDTAKGMGSGWERFEFDKDAPLDDEETEAVEDDAALVKHIGQTFRYSAVEARRAEEVKAAHDEAMFGRSAELPPPPNISDDEPDAEESVRRDNVKLSDPDPSLVNEKVLAKQQGSWRDRVRKS
uniref:Uncharacterized protein n=1 Tax=Kalanchoe fedtschenkoi TaxID=63787 RepID=A0A7N0VFP8_KALFE